MTEKRWLSHYPSEISTTIQEEIKPLTYYLKQSALDYPHKISLHFMGKEVSFIQLYKSTLKFANYLQGLGVVKGDRVAIMLPNCPQAVIAYYGILMAGGVVVQTNPLYTERELTHQLEDSGARAIVCLDLLYPRVSAVKAATQVEHIIVTGIKDFLPFPKNILYPRIQKKEHSVIVNVEHRGSNHLFTRILKDAKANEIDIDVDLDEDLAILQYTGGTTGFPKGVMLTHKNLVSNTLMTKQWMHKCTRGEEIMLGALPFFHVYGMTALMLLGVMEAYKIIIMPRFNPEDILKAIAKHRPTLFPGAPTMYIALLNHPKIKEYDLSSIKACMSGSAPLPLEVQEQFEKVTKGKLVEGYGLTESSPVTHSNFVWGKRINGSIGVPWPDTDAMIISAETGEEAPIKEIGEIVVRGPQVMKGYWKRPEETAVTLREGWLYTGDVGYMDEEGYFYIVDRKKDMIIAGGFNIYPREIEEVLYEHPKVQEVVTIGIPDEYRGETVKAFVVLKEGQECTEEELDIFARKYLAAYKVPRTYEFRKELPKTMIGKILRRVLVDEEKAKSSAKVEQVENDLETNNHHKSE